MLFAGADEREDKFFQVRSFIRGMVHGRFPLPQQHRVFLLQQFVRMGAWPLPILQQALPRMESSIAAAVVSARFACK